YREALEMTFYGAKVIHPKTLKPLIDAQIPLFVRSFENPGQPGTTVSFFPNLQYPTIKVLLKEQTLLQLTTRDFTFILENHLSKVFQLAVEYRVRIQMMENLAVNLSLVVNASPLAIYGFIDALNLNFQVEKTADLALYTIRHFDIKTVAELKADRKVYIEEYNKNTVQLVVGSDLSPFE
ncbi:MAG: hypothetical protein KDC53_09465, partial [Saprospiraceae bacterium]|nr:hypothetical protein [Saprospiraceae bacterium]